jgi:hypothetical protein
MSTKTIVVAAVAIGALYYFGAFKWLAAKLP